METTTYPTSYPRSLDQARDNSERAGFHWFDRDTLRYFGSRVHSTFYAGGFFVSSEYRGWDRRGRAYSVRRALPDGRIERVGDFLAYDTRAQAHAAARKASAEYRRSIPTRLAA